MNHNELAKATGYNEEAFRLISEGKIGEGYKLSPGIFEFYHDGPMGDEYQFSNEILPYLDKVVEWNETTKRFEGTFWGTLKSGDFEYRGWVIVDASDSTAFLPIEFEIQAAEGPDGEIRDHPFVGKKITPDENEMVYDVDYEI